MIGLSAKAAAENPSLCTWLKGAGLAVEILDAPAAASALPVIYSADEAEAATSRDVVIALRSGEPEFKPAGADTSAMIGFGYEDMAFGNALVAELVRPLHRPACGEPASARQLELAARVAASDASILVLGETGTGKEGMARYIHTMSPRAKGPFTAVNCAALPETMLEAILFGHRKGSFTGASHEGEGLFRAAAGGTLLLDEISEIPLALQAKLLRALQEKEVLPVGAVKPEAVDVRVIACANKDLAEEVAQGRFRADLYWRLNVVPLELAPLRQRRLDIRAIAAALLVRHVPEGVALPFPTAEALDRLMAHSWPGNCRELENVIQRALLLGAGERIHAADLFIDETPALPMTPQSLADASRDAEASLIRAALAEVGGHRMRAARRLGISERTLRYRLAEMRSAAA